MTKFTFNLTVPKTVWPAMMENHWTGLKLPDSDNIFVKAQARLFGDKVEVWSSEVENPVAVRFGWHEEATPNLINKEGLPASPFHTDTK